MKILHISSPLSWRGGEQQLAYLAAELREQEVEQVFLCAQGGAVEEFCFEQDLTSFPFSPGFVQMASSVPLLKRICKRYEIDVIHVHDAKAHTLAYVAALTGNKTPIIVSRRVDFPVKNSWLSRRKYNHPRIRRILCVSEKIKEITGASIQNKSVLRVIYDGIDTNIDLGAPKPGLHSLFHIPAPRRIIGNVAALAPHKDYFTWIDTARLLTAQNPNLHFLALGEGPTRPQIEAYLKQQGMESYITLAGFREDAKELMRSFDIFFTSSETEGLGSSTLDAFVRRAPVVATAAGGIPEIVKDKENGLLAPVKDAPALAAAISRLLIDDSLRQRLVDKAAAMVKAFDKKQMAAHTLAEYRAVIAEEKA